jgi:hypothetical protein
MIIQNPGHAVFMISGNETPNNALLPKVINMGRSPPNMKKTAYYPILLTYIFYNKFTVLSI